MKQTADLFGTRAQCIGMEIYYDVNVHDQGVHGKLTIHPKWSKRPQETGDVYVVVDEGEVDLVPDLLRDAWDGMNSADPGYYIPRWVKEHVQKYNNASK